MDRKNALHMIGPVWRGAERAPGINREGNNYLSDCMRHLLASLQGTMTLSVATRGNSGAQYIFGGVTFHLRKESQPIQSSKYDVQIKSVCAYCCCRGGNLLSPYFDCVLFLCKLTLFL